MTAAESSWNHEIGMDNPSQTAAPLGELQAIDACCDRFEAAWRQGQSPRLADFLNGVAPELRAIAAGTAGD